jgi:hypothetical protein
MNQLSTVTWIPLAFSSCSKAEVLC